MEPLAPLRQFVLDFTRLIDAAALDEERIFAEGAPLLSALVAQDGWLPDQYAQPSPERYQQYLLYCDPQARFSVLSFVWGPGQATPLHDHTVWGMVGVLRGAERCEEYATGPAGQPMWEHGAHSLLRGDVDLVSPRVGDIHRVSNADGGVSVSIHVYGADIGRVERHVYDPATGKASRFVSGYSDCSAPRLWP